MTATSGAVPVLPGDDAAATTTRDDAPAAGVGASVDERAAPLPRAVEAQPLVSVVIPCYGNAGTLASAIRSAVAQTYPNLEIVVVNDGSPDDTSGVARSFPGVVLVEQENAGPAAARNAGIGAARGDYVVVLDADDLLTPDVVERRLAVLLEDPTVGIVVGHHREIHADGRLVDRVPEVRRLPDDAFYAVVSRSFPPVGWTIRREALLDAGPYDAGVEPCEDWDLLIRIAASWKVRYDDRTSQLYRVTPGSLSTGFDRGFRSSRRVMRKNAHLAGDAARYRVAARRAGFYEARYLLGRMRLLPTWQERVAAFARTSWRAPAFLPYALVVLVTFPFWRRRVGL